MLFFLDENFPRSAVEFLGTHGHTAVRALDYFPQGTGDDRLFDKAQELGALFLSTDKDFFHTVPLLRTDRKIAVVAFTLAQPTRTKLLGRLAAFLETVPTPTSGDVYLVTDTRILKRN